MFIENDIFKRSCVIFNRLEKYGFKKVNNNYVYEKEFLNDDFKVIININKDGILSGKVIDLQFNEEYLGLRTNTSKSFASIIREEYKNILIDIKNKCFEEKYFISNQANRIAKYIKEKYNDKPEFLWDKYNGYGVFRNSNNKWYGIIMNIDFSKLDKKVGEVEIINVKLNKDKILNLLSKKGYYEAYHMSKKNWISIVLNDTLKDEEIIKLIDESYNLVKH